MPRSNLMRASGIGTNPTSGRHECREFNRPSSPRVPPRRECRANRRTQTARSAPRPLAPASCGPSAAKGTVQILKDVDLPARARWPPGTRPSKGRTGARRADRPEPTLREVLSSFQRAPSTAQGSSWAPRSSGSWGRASQPSESCTCAGTSRPCSTLSRLRLNWRSGMPRSSSFESSAASMSLRRRTRRRSIVQSRRSPRRPGP